MRPSSTHFFLQDANFNVTAAVDDDGNAVVERYAYTPYGHRAILNADYSVGGGNGTISAIDNTHLYTGRERDRNTGLQLNRRRFYHPLIGRWTTQDLTEYQGSQWSLYEYVASSPQRWSDPFGLECFEMLCPGEWLPPSDPKPAPTPSPGSQGVQDPGFFDPDGSLQCYLYFAQWGNSAPADGWLFNWGSEVGDVASIAGGIGAVARKCVQKCAQRKLAREAAEEAFREFTGPLRDPPRVIPGHNPRLPRITPRQPPIDPGMPHPRNIPPHGSPPNLN
jgi:RHS repeat-associated protein